ncbi:uncharacterized protein [Prorops nasuta]|uniref:uncharacterized protein n=1 Tax=Prorops nasuta TaxID=863751 RepID=UPI0034CDC600
MHHTLLHFDKASTGGSKARGTTPAINSSSEPEPSSSNSTTHLSITDTRSVLLATFSARIDALDGSRVIVRGLVDPSSETSFISENLVQQLRVPRKRIHATIQGVSRNSAHNVRAEAQITLHSLSRHGVSLDATALILPKITHYTPPTYSPSSFPALSEIDLADNFASTKVPIDVLLGADYFAALVEDQFIHSSDHSLIAQRTIFGWIVSGVLPREGRSPGLTVHHCFDLENTLRDFWELEEVPEVKPMSTEDSLCEQHFVDTVSRTYSGRFVVASPFRSDIEKHSLGSSSRTENQKTKIRVVFNASSKTSTGVSLNDTLFIGSKLQQDITRILMNLHSFRYVGVTDIVKIFRQILVRLEDRKYQNILWKTDSGEIQAFEFNTLTYGTNVLLNSTYVDDRLFGAHDLKQLSSVRDQPINLLAKGGFSLSKSTHSEIAFSVSEIRLSIEAIVKVVQHAQFANELAALKQRERVPMRSWLLPLYPTLDSRGILRMGGRLRNANLSKQAKHPIWFLYSSGYLVVAFIFGPKGSGLIPRRLKRTLIGGNLFLNYAAAYRTFLLATSVIQFIPVPATASGSQNFSPCVMTNYMLIIVRIPRWNGQPHTFPRWDFIGVCDIIAVSFQLLQAPLRCKSHRWKVLSGSCCSHVSTWFIIQIQLS